MPRIVAALFIFVCVTACKTTGFQARALNLDNDGIVYDGTADAMDSLPDCQAEIAGSTFWVRSERSAFECNTTGEWKVRQAAVEPEDAAAEDAEEASWGPRSAE